MNPWKFSKLRYLRRVFADEQEGPFVEYLRSLYVKRPLDLVLAIGGPAASFIQRQRAQLFPSIPVIFAAVEQRRMPPASLTSNDVAVLAKIDIARVFGNVLSVLPDTSNIAIVVGNSPTEKFWKDEIRKEILTIKSRFAVEWFNDFSFEEMLKRAAALPEHSAIFFCAIVS